MPLKSNEYSILDLNNVLFEKQKENKKIVKLKKTKKEVKNLEEKLDSQRLQNKRTQDKIYYLKTKLIEKGRSLKKYEVENIESNIRQLKKQKYDTRSLKNKINELSGKDYYVTIQNNFTDEKIKFSKLIKKKNPGAYVLGRLKEDIKAGKIKKSKSGANVRKKLLAKVKENERLIEKGLTEYENEKKDIGETNPPIIIDFVNSANIIAINV